MQHQFYHGGAGQPNLWSLLRAGVGDRALADMALFRRVAEHRVLFFRYSWVDYGTHKPDTFRRTPSSCSPTTRNDGRLRTVESLGRRLINLTYHRGIT
jgi:hypothetical protein